MDYGKSSIGFFLSLSCIMIFGFLALFSFSDFVVTIPDGSAFIDFISQEERYKFVFLALYYSSLFVFSSLVCGLAFVAGWLVNCVCIHIRYRKPQRVYSPDN